MYAAAAASRRAKPNRGRPLVPPNYISLRDLQELRLKEKEEQRRREEEEAAARRAREEQRKRQEEEEAAARRFFEERRRREEEAAARRARDAAAPAPRPEMRASSSSHASSFRCNERARGGQRSVVVADRPPPPPRGECAAVKIDGAVGGCRGKKGPGGGPAKPADASSDAGKPEEKRKGEASGCQGTASEASRAPGELAKVDIASYRGPSRPRHSRQGTKKGLDAQSTETAMASSIGAKVETSPLPLVNLESKGNSRSGGRSSGTALASMPGKAAEASPPRGVKSDNRGERKPLEGRQAAAAPNSDLQDGKKVEASGCEGTASVVSSLPSEHTNAEGASYRMLLKPMYRRKGKKGFDVRRAETATTIVAGKATDTSPVRGVNLEIKGKKGLTEQDKEKSLARMADKAADASLAPGFKSENNGKKESSGGRHAGMTPSTDGPDRMKAQSCPTAEGSSSQRSNGGQGTTWEAKPEGLQGKPEEQWWSRNSGRQQPGAYRRVNVTARQHAGVWVPKAAAVPDSVEVGKFP